MKRLASLTNARIDCQLMLSPLSSGDLFRPLQDPFAHDDGTRRLTKLGEIHPTFVLPRLEEGQIPRGIPELSQFVRRTTSDDGPGWPEIPKNENQPLTEVGEVSDQESRSDDLLDLDLWLAAAAFPPGSRQVPARHFETWNSHPTLSVTTGLPFLSEGGSNLLEAVLPDVDTKRSESYASAQTTTTSDALKILMHATLGTIETAELKWNPISNVFGWSRRVMSVDTAQSQATAQAFLDVATCMRRLEMLVDTSDANAHTSTHHALFHALSTYLTYVRQRLERARAHQFIEATQMLQDALRVLKALCEIMCWPLGSDAAQALSSQPVKVLNILHAHLASHLLVPSIVATPVQLASAYLLDKASQPWLDTLHRWVGLRPTSAEDNSSSDQPWATIGVEQSLTIAGHWEYLYQPKRMPSFVSKSQGRRIFEAGRSLRLLARATKGKHPLLGKTWEDVQGSWPWVQAGHGQVDLEDHLWSVRRYLRQSKRTRVGAGPSTDSTASLETATLQPLDLPFYARTGQLDLNKPLDENPLWKLMSAVPQTFGESSAPTETSQPAPSSSLWQSTSSFDRLLDLLDRHADVPLLGYETPTLDFAIETDVLAAPIAHGALASDALLTYFLEDLKLLEHLAILRAFFLGGDVGFTDRVRVALLGDGQVDGQVVGVGRRARTRMRLGFGQEGQAGASDAVWGIGLAIGLSDRQCWPPGGAELSYSLRTTLVDIEEKSRSIGAAGVSPEVWQEVDDRLSFAIRDSEQEDGDVGAKWQDPQAIEALDFLYLSYEPPPVMEVLLTPDILNKYQTIFGFLLRLSRVETVLRSVYNDVFHIVSADEQPIKQGVDAAQTARRSLNPFQSKPRARLSIFASQPAAKAMLHRLRFRMTHIVTALSQYIFDTAISRNWDIFMRRLDRLKLSNRRSDHDEDDGFGLDEDPEEGLPGGEIKDVHVLVLYHHHVLGRIMKGCMLGSSGGQQALFRILMGLFTVVLDIGKLIKEIAMRQVGEEAGAARLGSLSASWIEREEMLLHALDKLSARSGVSRSTFDDGDDDLATLMRGEDSHSAAQVDSGLGELLLRLQMSKRKEST